MKAAAAGRLREPGSLLLIDANESNKLNGLSLMPAASSVPIYPSEELPEMTAVFKKSSKKINK